MRFMGTLFKGQLTREYIAGNPLPEIDKARIVGETSVPANKVTYLPKISTRRGVTGYKGDPKTLKVIDADTGMEVKDAVTPTARAESRRK